MRRMPKNLECRPECSKCKGGDKESTCDHCNGVGLEPAK